MKTLKELGRALIHPGPIVTLLLIKTITLTTSYCTIMWWPPASSFVGCLWLFTFFSLSGSTLYNFLASMSVGPGHVPTAWRPEDEADFAKVQFCNICQGFKAPRAHHCRKCRKCVLKMDHHCPWINDCVGHRNHAHFVAFLLSAVFGCSQASFTIACSLYHALFRSYYIYHQVRDVPIVFLGDVYGLIWSLFVLGCAFGVSLGCAVLLFYQMMGILRNRTSIEEWIEEKAGYRRKADPELSPYEHPYSFGWKVNFWLVINVKCEPEGDGILWHVISTCDQYTLTVEQIEQKKDKQQRVQKVIVSEEYNGSWFPIRKGCCLAFHPPCTDESRIPLAVGEKILVSRWKKYWLYGEKVGINGDIVEVKGWFPRRSVTAQLRHRPTCKNYHTGNGEPHQDACQEGGDHSNVTNNPSESSNNGIDGTGDWNPAGSAGKEEKKVQ